MSSIHVDYGHSDFEKDSFLATSVIGKHLRQGALNLFLGAGVSMGFGFPSWSRLVARVVEFDDAPTKDVTSSQLKQYRDKGADELMRLVDDYDDGSHDYMKRVHRALYFRVAESLLDKLQQTPQLFALGAMITGSCRGRVKTVVTYNFDDLLEQHLRMLGYSYCTRFEPDTLSTRADVEINHVHGLVPQELDDSADGSHIVLSKRSFRKRQAFLETGWPAYIVQGLAAKVGLFIGQSGDDNSVLTYLERANSDIRRPHGYLGYWLLTPDAYSRNAKTLTEVNMCPIRLEKADIPRFLFAVCEAAA